jgi:hypothetical protein
LEFSDRSKRRQLKKTWKKLRESNSSNELIYAPKSALYESKHTAADLVSQVTEYFPNCTIKIRNYIEIKQNRI